MPYAATAATDSPASLGSVLGYAHVNLDGTVDLSHSKNIAGPNVTEPKPGFFCFKNLSFTPHSATANVDWLTTHNGTTDEVGVTVGKTGAASACGASSGARMAVVITANGSAGEQRGFYVSVN
jgi:hypothetical protein